MRYLVDCGTLDICLKRRMLTEGSIIRFSQIDGKVLDRGMISLGCGSGLVLSFQRDPKNLETLANQLGIFISVSLSLTVWLVLLATYIPYILFYSPMVIVGEHDTEDEALQAAVPGRDFGTGSASAVIILMAVFVDLLLLAGTYKKYQIKGDLVKKQLTNFRVTFSLDYKPWIVQRSKPDRSQSR